MKSGSTDEVFARQLQAELDDALLHTGVYARPGTRFFSIDSTLADLESANPLKRFEIPPEGEQMAVTATKVWKSPRGYMGLLKLETLSGKNMFAVAQMNLQMPIAIQFGRFVRPEKPSSNEDPQ